jgi:hypothetical protein
MLSCFLGNTKVASTSMLSFHAGGDHVLFCDLQKSKFSVKSGGGRRAEVVCLAEHVSRSGRKAGVIRRAITRFDVR